MVEYEYYERLRKQYDELLDEHWDLLEKLQNLALHDMKIWELLVTYDNDIFAEKLVADKKDTELVVSGNYSYRKPKDDAMVYFLDPDLIGLDEEDIGYCYFYYEHIDDIEEPVWVEY